MSERGEDPGVHWEGTLPKHDLIFREWLAEMKRLAEWKAIPQPTLDFPKDLEGPEASRWLLNYFVSRVKQGELPPKEMLEWLAEGLDKIVRGEEPAKALGLKKRRGGQSTGRRKLIRDLELKRDHDAEQRQGRSWQDAASEVAEKWGVCEKTVARALEARLYAGRLAIPLFRCELQRLMREHPERYSGLLDTESRIR